MSKTPCSSEAPLSSVRKMRHSPVDKKKGDRYILKLRVWGTGSNLRGDTGCLGSGSVERLLSGCEGCCPLGGGGAGSQRGSGLSILSSQLGSFTESISEKQSWRTGKRRVTTHDTQALSAALAQLSASEPSAGGEQGIPWERGCRLEPPPRPVCCGCAARRSAGAGGLG